GFLGSSLVRRLCEQGRRVRVLDDASRGKPRRLEGLPCELVAGDVRDPGVVARAAEGARTVVHYAFVNGTRFFYEKPELVLEVGVRGMVNVLDACRSAGVSELLLASSSEVYQEAPRWPADESVPLVVPDPLNPRYSYGAGKLISEMLLLHGWAKGLKRALIVRPHNVYGPDMGGEHVIPELALRAARLAAAAPGPVRLPIQGDGSQRRAFCHVSDFTEGVLAVLDKGVHRTIYHVGTPEERSIAEVARAVVRALGREAELVTGPAAKGGVTRRVPDVTRLSALGWRPKKAFEDGVAEAARWYAAHAAEFPEGGR
ncbi:NAD-dependent epimerase/dehydratase family protein, partial [bacterium]